jgi:autotransporter-associated beta strand protein
MSWACLAALAASAANARAQTQVFFTDFSSGIPVEFTATGGTHLTDVQGFAGMGPAGNQFGGNFLRYIDTDPPLRTVQLTFSSLPAHEVLNLGFLAAIIDSWDNESFVVKVDGATVFKQRFQNATGTPNSDYVAPPGGFLGGGQFGFRDFGFTGTSSFVDAAYNLYVEPSLNEIPHTASSVTIQWLVDPAGAVNVWEGGQPGEHDNESWGIDNVKVSVANATQWGANADGNFSDATKWTNGVPLGRAKFGDAITAPHTVTLDSPRFLNAITFDNANAYTLGGSNTLTLEGQNAGINVVSGSHMIATPLSLASNTTMDVAGGSQLSLGGTVSSTEALTKTGAGTLLVTGAVSITGTTTISAGTLQLGNGGAAGAISGDIANDGLLVFNRSGSVTMSSKITGSGSVTQQGSGIVTLSNTNNSWSGGTTISAGTLALGASNVLPTTGAINVSAGTLSMGSNSDAVGPVTLSASGSITGTGTLTASSYDVQSGSISAKLGGASAALTKTTSGTVTLSGANTYGGGTTINGGTLSVSTDANLGAALGAVSIDGATLAVTGSSTSARPFTLNAGGAIFDVSGSITMSNQVTGSGALTKAGTGMLILTANNNYGGGTTITGGTLQIGNSSSGTIAGSVAINADSTFAISRSDNVTFANTITGNGTLQKTGSGAVTIPTSLNIGAILVDLGGLILSSSATVGSMSVSTGGDVVTR